MHIEDPRRVRARRRAVALGGALGMLAGLLLVALSPLGGPVRRSLLALAHRFELGEAQVVVRGNEYLAVAQVRRVAGLAERTSFFRTPLDAAQARLESHPRIRRAQVRRRWDGKIALEIEERRPVALLPRRRPIEIDAEGRLLPPLAAGAVADRPIVRGLDEPVKGRLEDPAWARALAWMEALATPEIQLLSRLSEIDVRDDGVTQLVLSPQGTRVLLPAGSSGRARLAALRIVLADLQEKDLVAETIDCRAVRMVVVRPAASSRSSESGKTNDSARRSERHS